MRVCSLASALRHPSYVVPLDWDSTGFELSHNVTYWLCSENHCAGQPHRAVFPGFSTAAGGLRGQKEIAKNRCKCCASGDRRPGQMRKIAPEEKRFVTTAYPQIMPQRKAPAFGEGDSTTGRDWGQVARLPTMLLRVRFPSGPPQKAPSREGAFFL